MIKRKLGFILALVLGLAIPFMSSGVEALALEPTESQTKAENSQSYITPEGDSRKVYWAEGIEAPLIPDASPKQENRSYFKPVKESFGGNNFFYYDAIPEIGKGYYDFNKNIEAYSHERNLCYLGTAANMLMWWLEQNKPYIDTFRALLQAPGNYDNAPVLKQLLPYNEAMWDEIYPELKFKDHDGDGVYRIEMHDYAFFNKVLNPYYYRNDGGFPDHVFDYFINGYQYREESFHDQNSEPNYVPGANAGYFYNIFGKTRLSKRYDISNYNDVSRVIKESLTSGKMIGLSFMTASLNVAHAITVWGAEFDEFDNIKRIFITDTDDYGNTISRVENGQTKVYGRGLTSINVNNANGIARLTTQVGLNVGAKLEGLYTLSLGQDIWEEKLKNTGAPKAPEITFENPDALIALNADSALKVEGKLIDDGMLSYEWFESTSPNEPGKAIPNSNSSIYKPKTNTLGVKYYYCLVYNERNGFKTPAKSRYIKVTVDDVPIRDAETPRLIFSNNSSTSVNQYSEPYKLEIKASVSQGTLSYQWYQNTQSSTTDGWVLPGETKPYIYVNTKEARRYIYYCVVTNNDYSENITGKRTVSARPSHGKIINVIDAPLVDAAKPFIKNEINDLNVNLNENINLKLDVMDVDGGTISYAWYALENDQYTLIPNENKNYYKPNTNKPGSYTYKCVITNNNSKASKNKTATTEKIINVNIKADSGDLPAPDVNFGEVIYSWDLSNLTLTAKRTDLNNPLNTEAETVKISYEVAIAATCDTAGSGKYTSEAFTNPAFIQQTKVVEIEPIGHDYGEVSYTWNADHSELTAKRVCKHNPLHVEQETVKVSYAVIKAPSCEDPGLGRYTSANFINEAFKPQSLDVILEALGHDFGEVSYSFDLDALTLTATRICKHDPLNKETETVKLNKKVTNPTCLEDGSIIYESLDFVNPAFKAQAKTVVLPKLGHDYQNPSYSFSEDNKTLTGTLICSHDINHRYQETVNVSYEIIKAPTAKAPGLGRYTSASFENPLLESQTKDVVIPMLDLDFADPIYTWDLKGLKLTAKRVSKTDSSIFEEETVSLSYEIIKEVDCEKDGLAKFTSASFKNPMFVAQTRQVVIPALEHNFADPTYTWDLEGLTITAKRVCLNNPADIETETVSLSYKIIKAADCLNDGLVVFTTEEFKNKGFVAQEKKVAIPSTGHSFGEVSYTWDLEGLTLNAKRICKNDASHIESEDVALTKQIIKPADCLNKGLIRYTSQPFNNLAFAAQMKEVEIPALGHDYGEVIYTWNLDNLTLRAERVCANDSSHRESEIVYISKTIKAASCLENGLITYTSANFQNPSFSQQTKEVEIPALGHDFGEVSYSFDLDKLTLTAKRVCKNDNSHIEEETVRLAKEIIIAPSCLATGLARYTSEAFKNLAFKAQTKDEVIKALGHSFGEVSYSFDLDKLTLTAKRVCRNDNSHIEEETVKLTKAVENPSCLKPGKITYQSSEFTNPAFKAQTKVVEIKALGHDFGEVSYSFDLDKLTLTAKHVCKNDNSHIEEETVKLNYRVITEATCHQVGKAIYESNAFKNPAFKVQTKEVELPKLEHVWGEWVIVSKPTEIATGLKERTCELCGDKETEIIPALAPSTDDSNNSNSYINILIGVFSVAFVGLAVGLGIYAYKKKQNKVSHRKPIKENKNKRTKR